MGGENETCTYRLLKHALKPMRDGTEWAAFLPTSEKLININFYPRLAKTPLSAYIVRDMMEYVAAHATYRFVIRDEEEDKVRMLVCAFSPSAIIASNASRYGCSNLVCGWHTPLLAR